MKNLFSVRKKKGEKKGNFLNLEAGIRTPERCEGSHKTTVSKLGGWKNVLEKSQRLWQGVGNDGSG